MEDSLRNTKRGSTITTTRKAVYYMDINALDVKNRTEFREWLSFHCNKEKECWLILKRGKPIDDHVFYYLDAVEEALCFGWIDSVQKVVDGICYQRFSPRGKGSYWSELNKERVRRLESLGLMKDEGRAVLPSMGPRSFKIDEDIVDALKKARAWSTFKSFPELYQRVRAYNVWFYKDKLPENYSRALTNLVEQTKQGKMYGEWNDYGRLLDY